MPIRLGSMAEDEHPVTIELSDAEALVLFEWLASHDELPFDDAAEQSVLWSIEAQLEKTLIEPFRPEYRALVDAARAAVRTGSPYRGMDGDT